MSQTRRNLKRRGGAVTTKHMGSVTRRLRAAKKIKNEFVEVKNSPVEGLGVFATADIAAGTKIADYYGKEMTWRDFKAKYGEYKTNSQYSYPMRRIWKILVAKEEPYFTMNLVNYINESPKKTNSELKKRALYAIKDIKKGEELFLQYPKDYNRFWL